MDQPQPASHPHQISPTDGPLPLYATDSYTWLCSDADEAEAPRKLRGSAVAPLVAAARGYEWVRTGESSYYKDVATRLGLGPLNTGLGRKVRDLASAGGVLLMPLFSLDDAYKSAVDGLPSTWRTMQLRPLRPRTNDQGKLLKYEFVAGTGVPIDVHPSVPLSWIQEPLNIVISEGTIKIDAALTAICRQYGVSDAELCDVSGDPRERLREILEGLPVSARHLCVSFAGVASWHSNPELGVLPMRDRQVWIAFDKDVDVNRQVWNQADKLWSYIKTHHGTPLLVDLSVSDANRQDVRAGLDDFLAEYGVWSDLGGRLLTEMPPCPAKSEIEARPGDWRMNEDKLCAEELVQGTDADGRKTNMHVWERRVPIVGRIKARIDRRSITEDEVDDGILQLHVPDEGSEQFNDIELTWTPVGDSDGDPILETFVVPSSTLGARPADWYRLVSTPASVSEHPAWPPPMAWLAALKANRAEEIEHRVEFQHMGWVPTPKGMRFLIGPICIGPDGEDEATKPGCNEHLLADADKFGATVLDDNDEAARYIHAVIDSLLRRNTFNQEGLAELVLATALRPVIPIQVRTPILFSGPRRVGKSWTAAAILSFWQWLEGTWTENSLPGSTKDTRAANENTQARSAIWVFDDLAPSVSVSLTRQEEATLENIVRACHNQSVKRRMTRDMHAVEVLRPRALPIITAENALTVSSVMDRCIHYQFQAGTLGDKAATDHWVELRDISNAPSVVSGSAIIWMARRIRDNGYRNTVAEWQEIMSHIEAEAVDKLGGGGASTRHAKMCADILVGLHLLVEVLRDLGLEDDATLVEARMDRFYAIPKIHYQAQSESTPGMALLEALRAVLESGAGYITDLRDNGMPKPPQSKGYPPFIAQLLGWTSDDDKFRTKGTQIGYYAPMQHGDYILFTAHAAFQLAKRHFPALIPPGSKASSAWSSIWDEGIAAGWAKPANSATVQVARKSRPNSSGTEGDTAGTTASVRGVPIPLDYFVRPLSEVDEGSVVLEIEDQ